MSRIKKETVLVNKLKARKLVLPKVPRPFRADILNRMGEVGKRLRDPEYFGNAGASYLFGRFFDRLGRLVLGRKVRGQEPGELEKTYPRRRTM